MSALLALLLVNNPASELLNESLLTIACSQARQQESVGFFAHIVGALRSSLDDRIVQQCEHRRLNKDGLRFQV